MILIVEATGNHSSTWFHQQCGIYARSKPVTKWLTVGNRSTAPFPEEIIAVGREMFSTITFKELLTECEGTILFLT